MKVKTLCTFAGASALLVAGAASADFTGVNIEFDHQWENEGTLHNVFRLYANFDDPANGVGFWGGQEGDPLSISNTLGEAGTEPGSGFFAFSTNLPASAGNPLYEQFQDQFDNSTYITIGAEAGYTSDDIGEVFQLTPEFDPSFNGATDISADEAGVVANPGSPNGIAGDDNRVLLGQFTAVDGEWVHVDGIVQWYGSAAAGGNVESFSVSIPAPGALALFGVAGLAGFGRRRRA